MHASLLVGNPTKMGKILNSRKDSSKLHNVISHSKHSPSPTHTNSCISMAEYHLPAGVQISGRYDAEYARILTRDALQFVADLQREFRSEIVRALELRKEAQKRYDGGELPRFDPDTEDVRAAEWTCAAVPPAVADRRVEITGPPERKMVINALNSGAKVFMVKLGQKFQCL